MKGFKLIIFNKNLNASRFENNFITKFSKDIIIEDSSSKLNFFLGLALNRSQLGCESPEEWKRFFISNNKVDFIKSNKFKGTFIGGSWDKIKNTCFIYNDQIGSKPLYYFHDNNVLIVSSNVTDIYDELKVLGIKYSLNVEAAYMLLSYGYMLGDSCLGEGVKKLKPGSVLNINERFVLNIDQYYKLPISEDKGNINKDEAIEKIDFYFRNAITQQFGKDNEYNFKHLVALSGGLDSRMTSWVSHQMGYTNQLNFTFSQTNYLDELIPKAIASDLFHDWIFKSLDNGLFLKDLEEITKITGGNVLYYGLAHGNSLYKSLNFKNLGIVHSGQLGDVALGSFIKRFDTADLTSLGGAYSKRLAKKFVHSDNNWSTFGEMENSMIYERGFNGANNGLLSVLQYTETYSPFYNLEFMEACLQIPIEHRMNHKLYFEWILKNYPKASNYIWESTGTKITNKFSVNLNGKKVPLHRIPGILLYKLGFGKSSIQSKNHMNPLDYWFSTNIELRDFINNYFENNINKIINSQLKEDCRDIFLKGNATEKNQVISLLSAINLYFS